MEKTLNRTKFKNSITAPSSKSELHRLLLCAMLSEVSVKIAFDGILSDDIRATLDCISALNSNYSISGNTITVYPPENFPETAELYCGNSGTTLRFFTAVCASLNIKAALHFSEGLSKRPLEPLLNTLTENGAVFTHSENKITVSKGIDTCRFRICGNVSSQFISGLLFACTIKGGTTEIIGNCESSSYIGLTVGILESFGADIVKNAGCFYVKKSFPFRRKNTCIAGGDWSNSAFALIAGAIGKSEVTVSGLDNASVQGDSAIVGILKRMGAEIRISENSITAYPSALKGITFSGRDIPDIVMPLCIAALCAEGETQITDIDRLKLKETDRITAVCNLIDNLGGKIIYEDGTLHIFNSRLHGGRISGCNDHRTVMTAVLASTVCDGAVSITDIEAVEKSYPAFFDTVISEGRGNIE